MDLLYQIHNKHNVLTKIGLPSLSRVKLYHFESLTRLMFWVKNSAPDTISSSKRTAINSTNSMLENCTR